MKKPHRKSFLAMILIAAFTAAKVRAASEIIVRTPAAVCVDLVNIDLSANAASDRIVSLGRFFSEDYPLFYAKAFESEVILAFGGDLKSARNHADLPIFDEVMGPAMIRKLEDLKVDRARGQPMLESVAAEVRTKIENDILRGSASEVARAYGFAPKDFLIVQDAIRTIQSLPEMNLAMSKLVEEVVFQSVDSIIVWAKLHVSTAGAFRSHFFTFAPLDPRAYCALGRCVQRAATRKRIMRKAIATIVEGRSEIADAERSAIDLRPSEVQYEDLLSRLKAAPDAILLGSYAGVLDFDREFRRAFHELELKANMGHTHFKSSATWASFARDIENARAGGPPAVFSQIARIRTHTESFQRNLRFQRMGVAQSQESIIAMRESLLSKLKEFSGDLSPGARVYKDALEQALLRNDASMAESIIMAEGIEDWLSRCDRFLALLESLGRRSNGLISSSNGSEDIAREFGQLRKELGVSNR
jgi:hypothetical protein